LARAVNESLKMDRRLQRDRGSQAAGINGIVERRPLGSYRHNKSWGRGEARLWQCIVFPRVVSHEVPPWREQTQRTRAWFPTGKATELVNEGTLAVMTRNLLEAPRPVQLGKPQN
jgi:hypothetical protein